MLGKGPHRPLSCCVDTEGAHAVVRPGGMHRAIRPDGMHGADRPGSMLGVFRPGGAHAAVWPDGMHGRFPELSCGSPPPRTDVGNFPEPSYIFSERRGNFFEPSYRALGAKRLRRSAVNIDLRFPRSRVRNMHISPFPTAAPARSVGFLHFRARRRASRQAMDLEWRAARGEGADACRGQDDASEALTAGNDRKRQRAPSVPVVGAGQRGTPVHANEQGLSPEAATRLSINPQSGWRDRSYCPMIMTERAKGFACVVEQAVGNGRAKRC